MKKMNNYASFMFQQPEGLLRVSLEQKEPTSTRVEMFAKWCGKSLVMLLLIALLRRINNDFNDEKGGWHFQDEDIVSSLKTEMSGLLAKEWTGKTVE